jgi:radical SAM C-methyltransferase
VTLDITLVQQGAWDMPLDSMPLAVAYLKATLAQDRDLDPQVDVSICNFRGGVTLTEMARQLFSDHLPDVLAFSVLGWNLRNFSCLAETFKQMNPSGVVVFGGNHVAYQAERVFRQCGDVDVVVNGEGEFIFRDIVAEIIANPVQPAFEKVSGLSCRAPDGSVLTTVDRERIDDLDVIPSPFLTNTLPMTDDAGRFRYDVALMETNRGCPYKCSFCYWGGAVGQRVRSFSRERLAEELDHFGFYQVQAVVLCDANFGLLEADEEFVEDLIKTRERYGYPQALETSWAKNKSSRFHDIVRSLKRSGFKSSFTLALQTLSDEALTEMQRRNMKVNKWETLVDWLRDEGLDCYAELIWGAPGETPESFLEGYDRLASRVSRIAVYPLLLLPNTAYMTNKADYGFVTVRGENDDFEYVLANKTAGFEEHRRMQRFMYWARIVGENQFLRLTWRPLRDLVGLGQSTFITELKDRFDRSTQPAAVAFTEAIPYLAESPAIAAGLRSLYSSPDLAAVVAQWWQEEVLPRCPVEWRAFMSDLYEFERWSRPVYAPDSIPPVGWRVEERSDGDWFVSDPVDFGHDVENVLAEWPCPPPAPRPTRYVFEAPAGFAEHLDNHETGAHYVARPRAVPLGSAEVNATPVLG